MIYIYAHRGDGTAVPFTKVVTSASLYTSDGDVADVLSGTPIGGYVYVDKQNGSIEQYTGDGLITSITTARGERMTFTYSVNTTPVSIAPGAGHLLRVEDSKGRAVEFEYALSSLFAPSRITRVKDSSGRYLQFSYSTAGELASITWQDGRTREFKYELASLPSALTGVVDERGVRSASFGYSASGVALSTENAGGLNRFAVSYLQEPVIEVESESYDLSTKTVSRTLRRIAPQGVQITTPNNMPVDLLSTIVGGTPFVLGKSQPAGSGCAASTSSSTYDANGNATSTDDFNGTRSCSVYSGTLETVRVDGLSNNTACSTVTGAGTTLPANSRKTAMAWHPQWRLQTKLAEPRKLTTTVYNGQPDPFNGNAVASCAPAAAPLPDGTPIAVICKTVEQATTDLDGKFGLSATIDASVPNRINTFTYNQFGSVLTATDARNFTTTYAYYPTSTATAKIGDLQSITNAVGKVQTFDAYDATGALLSSTDPRGAVTTYSYDNRQRLLSTSVAGLITSYAYDNAGRLATVTMPDTSSIQYGYDDANRMTGITDSAGNTVTYVLDTSGNATSEQWKDSTGALAKNITRVFDALNRLQSATGARQ